MRSCIIFYGSHGSITVDSITGNVLTRYHDDSSSAYADIERVDIAEWRQAFGHTEVGGEATPGTCDILELGFWTRAGQFIRPEFDYRANCWTPDIPPEQFTEDAARTASKVQQ